jgi:anti-sigma B factor antagonist
MPDHGLAARTPRVVSVEAFDEHGATVVVSGDLDLATAPQLDEAISGQIAEGHRQLVIDLSGATFLDSMAMGTLLASIAPLRDDPAGEVVLTGAHGMVGRSLAISGIGAMFTMYDTRGAAICEMGDGTESLRHTRRNAGGRPDRSV